MEAVTGSSTEFDDGVIMPRRLRCAVIQFLSFGAAQIIAATARTQSSAALSCGATANCTLHAISPLCLHFQRDVLLFWAALLVMPD
jgi:hypothetical protein